ncbi:MAG: sn-glycerol-3-phosphate ABC transporter ATP-binding protein UgpC [Caulobacteraceae bacterium]
MAGVELRGVSKSFGKTVVIDQLSLGIESKEFIVFLGPSGCGKSTLLRMIAGLESVDAGEILIEGRRIDSLPPGERGVAMVFQHYALYPHMTIRENMAFGLRNVGTAPAEIVRRVEAAAAILEIGPLLDRRPVALSGGQRQRVAIGRAIVKEPQVFLFDEPLSNLDAALRMRTRVELAQLHQRVASTMIFVTHDQVEAMTLADRIVVLNGGRIEQVGSPMDIYNQPATSFVAGFVGSPAINFLPVRVSAGADGGAVATLANGAAVATRIDTGGLPPEGAFTLGVRPEAVVVADPAAATVQAVARVVERLGDRSFIYAETKEGSTLVAEDIGMSRVAVGDAIGLNFDSTALCLFDGQGRGHHTKADA